MKNLFCFKLNNTLRPSRLCYDVISPESFSQENDQMKKLEEVKKDTSKYFQEVARESNLEARQSQSIKGVLQSSISSVNTLADQAIFALGEKIRALASKVGTEPTLTDADKKDDQKLKKYLEEKKAYEARKKDYDSNHGHQDEIQTAINKLRGEVIQSLTIEAEKRETVLEELKKRIARALAENIDPETLAQIKDKADFASNLADDGWLTSVCKDEVKNYKDSKLVIDGKETGEINHSDLEDITMGIVAVLHDRKIEDEKEDDNPARAFMRGLAEREKNSAKFRSLEFKGVRAQDVQLQVLKDMHFNDMNEENGRERAQNSPAGRLIATIANDKNLPPALKGMLLGKLIKAAQISEQGVDAKTAAVATVDSMYHILLDSRQVSAIDNSLWRADTGGTIAAHAATGATLIGGAGAAAGSLVGPLGTAGLGVVGAGIGAIGGAIEGTIYTYAAGGGKDERNLKQAGLLMSALEHAQEMKTFQDAITEWRTYHTKNKEALKNDPDAKKIEAKIAELEKNPANIERVLGNKETSGTLLFDIKNRIAGKKSQPQPVEAKSLKVDELPNINSATAAGSPSTIASAPAASPVSTEAPGPKPHFLEGGKPAKMRLDKLEPSKVPSELSTVAKDLPTKPDTESWYEVKYSDKTYYISAKTTGIECFVEGRAPVVVARTSRSSSRREPFASAKKTKGKVARG